MAFEPEKRQAPPSRLDDMQKVLYRREDDSARFTHRDQLVAHDAGAAREWEHPAADLSHEEVIAVRSSFWARLFAFSLVFFALAAGFGAYILFGGTSTVSSQNVAVSVLGPVSIAAGDPLTLEVTIRNKNSATLTGAELIVEYPDGTKRTDNPDEDLPRERIPLGDVASGALLHHSISAVLFGEESEAKTIKFSVQYHLSGSSSLFYADSPYQITISSSPVSLKVTSLKEITAGQKLEFTVEVVSNSATVVKGMLVHADYPFGFAVKSSDPKPSYGSNLWQIGDLEPGGKRTIKVSGTLGGQDGESRVFKFQTGTQSKTDQQSIGTSFVDASQSVTVRKPFIGIGIALDGVDAAEYSAAAGKTVHVTISWTNNTPGDINDAEIDAKLNGDLFDESSVQPQGGFYRSSDNTIVWSKATNPELAHAAAGAKGTVSFSFATLPISKSSGSVRNPQVGFDVSVLGKRLSDSSVPETVTSVASRVVKLSSNLSLISRAIYSAGPFKNSGPVPPKANAATTYTIVWSITNTANPVKNAQVSAVLPPYVTWSGVFMPTTESISYDSNTRMVEWTPGAIAVDAGVTGAAREAAFQVSLLPSISQVGTAPQLVGPASLTGEDSWSGADLSSSKEALTTRTLTDPAFSYGQETVTK